MEMITPQDYTQDFINHASSNNARIFKVPRKLNTTAQVLASQALTNLSSTTVGLQLICSNQMHVSGCPSYAALNSVSGDFTIIAASCC
jgi:hypothetical protein